MKIAIVGAGWYGSHIASSFMAIGFEITVFEKANRVMAAASGHNQYRLHQGFHYARNHRTRIQSREGYARFMERYAQLSGPIQNNIYVVPDQDSFIDFLTYRLIMSSSGLDFIEVDPQQYGVVNCRGGMRVHERLLMTNKARDFFTSRLGSVLKLDHDVKTISQTENQVWVDGNPFDYLVDASWGACTAISRKVFFEPTLLLYYRSAFMANFALTAVDGNLCSIYPCEETEMFTLSSVPHTPLGRYESSNEAWAFLSRLTSNVVQDKRKLMEEQIERYIPMFRDQFEYVGPQFSVKTKIEGLTDDRSCYVEKQGRIFKVLSGKVDTIFHASDTILSMLEYEIEHKQIR
jgi:hypothetical protein